MKKLIVMFVMTLGGCATTPKPVAVISTTTGTIQVSPASSAPVEKAKTTIDIDKELLKECPKLSKLQIANATPNQILDQHANDVLVSTACRIHHSALIKIVKDAFNIQD